MTSPKAFHYVCPNCGNRFRIRSNASRRPKCGTPVSTEEMKEQAVTGVIVYAVVIFLLIFLAASGVIPWN